MRQHTGEQINVHHQTKGIQNLTILITNLIKNYIKFN